MVPPGPSVAAVPGPGGPASIVAALGPVRGTDCGGTIGSVTDYVVASCEIIGIRNSYMEDINFHC